MNPTTPKEAMLRAAEIAEPHLDSATGFEIWAVRKIIDAIRAEAEKLPDEPERDVLDVAVFDPNKAWGRTPEEVWRGRFKIAEAEREALAARVRELEQGLRDVCNPLDYLRRKAEAEDRRLNGGTYMIANDLGFVQTIARVAIKGASDA